MKFCTICGHSLFRNTSTGVVLFKCPSCDTSEKGTEHDIKILTKKIITSETIEMYRTLIDNASFDRTNQLISKVCKKCGLDYMTRIRVGSSESIIYKCKCGYETI